MMASREKCLKRCSFTLVTFALVVLTSFLAFPSVASAQQTWYAEVGAENHSEAKQADAFLPNEIWIYAGDSITFKFAPKHEIHTVTFLAPNQIRPGFAGPLTPPPPVGCDAVNSELQAQLSGSSYDGVGTGPYLACVNSGPMTGGASYTVTFPTPGNYKMVCLVHADMNGVVHVLQNTDPTRAFCAASLPYQQSDYDAQARGDHAHPDQIHPSWHVPLRVRIARRGWHGGNGRRSTLTGPVVIR